MARESSQTLNKIVDDLLDVAKFERGKLPMRMGAFDLTRLVRDAVERFRAPADTKSVTMSLKASLEARVVGDADRVGQVLNNLLANAIKFTPDGGRVQVAVFGPELSTSLVGVSVWNSGEPIPAAARERVFEKFEQLEGATTRRVGGTGLGLAIARGIVEGHGGRMWVEPTTEGAKFVFTLPVTPPEHDERDEQAPPAAAAVAAVRVADSPRMVLVVDDDPDARLLLKGILLGAGHAVETACDGDEALAAARDRRPDAISIDLELSGFDGVTLVEILKHDPETRAIPIVVLSASGERERPTASGADAYLRKPVEPSEYAATVTHLVAERGRARQRILLVDDDPSIRMICREVLEGARYVVAEADGGDSAQVEARRFHPDLILLDVMMPDVDGFALAQRLREERATALTPVIFLSARGQTADKVRAFKLGAEDYLVKPFDSAELLARVEKALAKREAELSASPTTKLPGSHAIEAEISRRLALAHAGGGDFAFCYLDLDNLKAFNDYYGYAKADGVIRQTGDVVRDVIGREGEGQDFIGHIAGDDFVFITSVARVDRVCKTVCATFDRLIPLYYDKRDRERGFIETQDRYGELRRFPIMTVSIAAVTRTSRIPTHADLAEVAADLKQQAKAIPASSYVRDGEVILPAPSVVKAKTGAL
jgi:DNA-binding response OmpR family regulator